MSNQVMEKLIELQAQMNASPQGIAHLHAYYAFHLKEGWQVYVHIADGKAAVSEVPIDQQADCTIILSENDMIKLLSHQLNSTFAYMTGAIKIEGRMGPAIKLLEALSSYK